MKKGDAMAWKLFLRLPRYQEVLSRLFGIPET